MTHSYTTRLSYELRHNSTILTVSLTGPPPSDTIKSGSSRLMATVAAITLERGVCAIHSSNTPQNLSPIPDVIRFIRSVLRFNDLPETIKIRSARREIDSSKTAFTAGSPKITRSCEIKSYLPACIVIPRQNKYQQR